VGLTCDICAFPVNSAVSFDDSHFGYAAPMRKPVTIAAILVATPVAALSGCQSNQPANNQPSASTSATATSTPPGAERLTTQLKSADGTPVANATFDFANGYATVTVETVATQLLNPGFHGLHIHSMGKCEANSVAPTGGAPGDFNSAGGHYQASGHSGHPASGDLTSLEVRSDGAAKLVTTTDAFTAADLLGGAGTALIIHEGPDNFGNISTDRYTQKNGAPGPDEETLATGDSGKRVACGVIGSASSNTSTTTTATTTAAVTPTTGPAVTTGGATTPEPTSVPTSTSTSTVTVTVPSVSAVTPTTSPGSPMQPANPGGG
jgi:Cu-Zn family superoxide dismutase